MTTVIWYFSHMTSTIWVDTYNWYNSEFTLSNYITEWVIQYQLMNICITREKGLNNIHFTVGSLWIVHLFSHMYSKRALLTRIKILYPQSMNCKETFNIGISHVFYELSWSITEWYLSRFTSYKLVHLGKLEKIINTDYSVIRTYIGIGLLVKRGTKTPYVL